MGKKALIYRWYKIIKKENRVAIRQSEGKFYEKDFLLGYYNDLRGKVNENTTLDKNGIPINLVENNKWVYFPISIFQYGLGVWDKYIETREEAFRQMFLKIADWAVSTQAEDGSWDCFSSIGYKTLTVSAMGQGEGVSLLSRAYLITKRNYYLESIKKAVRFMSIDIKDGGVKREENGKIILEEYPDNNKKSVLNGWIFSIFGLIDYLKIVKDMEASELLRKTLMTLKKELPKYDMGYWSFYDQSGRVTSPFYHELHISLLKVLYDLTGIDEFNYYSIKWENYKKSNIKKYRAILKKIIQKMTESTEGIVIQ